MDATYLAVMADFIPSMSDTILGNNSAMDQNEYTRRAEKWCNAYPGVTATIGFTFEEALNAATLETSLSFTYEFKQRLPKEGLQWLFMRTSSKKLERGRMDTEVIMCNEKMELVCIMNHLVAVLDAARKFGKPLL